jgi:hypothetical protein
MANNGGFGINILVLDGKNWERWSALMKLLFGAVDVLELMENGYELKFLNVLYDVSTQVI